MSQKLLLPVLHLALQSWQLYSSQKLPAALHFYYQVAYICRYPVGVLHKSVDKSVPQDCSIRVSDKSVPTWLDGVNINLSSR